MKKLSKKLFTVMLVASTIFTFSGCNQDIPEVDPGTTINKEDNDTANPDNNDGDPDNSNPSGENFTATYKFTESVRALTDYIGTAGADETYVEFGDWPQTLAVSGITFNEQPEANGYYVGSDGNYYAKCLENACGDDYTYANGTAVAKKNANSYKYFKVEPIKWRVMDTAYDYDGDGTDTAKLLVAESILTANIPYYEDWENNRDIDDTVYPNNYMHSQIRAYLNGISYAAATAANNDKWKDNGFLQSAFTTTAQEKIKTTTVKNDDLSTQDFEKKLTCSDGTLSNDYPNYTCADTNDKIFLLSEYEITKYSAESYNEHGVNNSRIRKTTDYSKANIAYQDSTEDYGGCWWLRSSHYSGSYYARSIIYDGFANCYYYVTNVAHGIVPALSISFSDNSVETVATPIFSIPEGAIGSGTTIEITCTTIDSTIYYTTDGTEPTYENGIKYTSEITITPPMIIKAIAIKEGMKNSNVAKAVYTPSVTTYKFTENVRTLTDYSGTAGAGETYVEFGDWPQTLAVSGVTFNTNPETSGNGKGYFVGSDGNYYAKYQEKYYKVEPIKWRVMDTAYDYDGDGTETAKLLVAESILTANVPYFESFSKRDINGTVYPNNYMHSQIRAFLNGISYVAASSDNNDKWLNQGFLQSAFTTTAQEKIKTTTVDNSDDSTINYDTTNGTMKKAITFSCADTEDKIFLLSEYEVTKYSTEPYNKSDNNRIRKATDYAKANNAVQYAGYGGCWWLRSPDYDGNNEEEDSLAYEMWKLSRLYARGIDSEGMTIGMGTIEVTWGGVVPALVISF